MEVIQGLVSGRVVIAMPNKLVQGREGVRMIVVDNCDRLQKGRLGLELER